MTDLYHVWKVDLGRKRWYMGSRKWTAHKAYAKGFTLRGSHRIMRKLMLVTPQNKYVTQCGNILAKGAQS